MKSARGSCKKDDKHKLRPQIVIRFDRKTFNQVRRLADHNGASFNETIRLLVEWGLEEANRVQ